MHHHPSLTAFTTLKKESAHERQSNDRPSRTAGQAAPVHAGRIAHMIRPSMKGIVIYVPSPPRTDTDTDRHISPKVPLSAVAAKGGPKLLSFWWTGIYCCSALLTCSVHVPRTIEALHGGHTVAPGVKAHIDMGYKNARLKTLITRVWGVTVTVTMKQKSLFPVYLVRAVRDILGSQSGQLCSGVCVFFFFLLYHCIL